MQQNYTGLLSTVASKLNIADVKEVVKSGEITFNDVNFVIPPMQDPNSPLLFIFCDFGPLPEEREQEILRHLLENNIETNLTCAFALHPKTRHVILQLRREIDVITADEMVKVLNVVAEQALVWRRTHYLEVEE